MATPERLKNVVPLGTGSYAQVGDCLRQIEIANTVVNAAARNDIRRIGGVSRQCARKRGKSLNASTIRVPALKRALDFFTDIDVALFSALFALFSGGQ